MSKNLIRSSSSPSEPETQCRCVQLRRRITLAIALWGKTKTPDDLQRQLLERSSEIRSGFGLTDFQERQRSAEKISSGLSDPRYPWFASCGVFFVGTQRFTASKARCSTS
jgi:hypothetical protein